MATWEDGPEYAPRERPQYFADAPVAPLEQAPRPERPADGLPTARPHFDQPTAPVAPLAELVPPPPDERDPARPFDVVTASLTSESSFGSPAGGGPNDPTQPLGPAAGVVTAIGVPVSQPVGSGPGAPAGPDAWPDVQAPAGPGGFPSAGGSPNQPAPFPHAAPREPYAAPYPSPGTPGWFAPPPATYGEQRRPGRPTAKDVFEAATPGLCICLALGGLVIPLAPVLLVVAVFLSMRVQVAQTAVRMTLRVAAGAVGFFAVVGLYRSVFIGDPWWDFLSSWSVAICWVSLVVVLLVVWQALRRTEPPAASGPPAAPGPWG